MLLVTRNLSVLNGQKIRLNFLQILSQPFCYLELSFIPLFPHFLFYSEEKNNPRAWVNCPSLLYYKKERSFEERKDGYKKHKPKNYSNYKNLTKRNNIQKCKNRRNRPQNQNKEEEEKEKEGSLNLFTGVWTK